MSSTRYLIFPYLSLTLSCCVFSSSKLSDGDPASEESASKVGQPSGDIDAMANEQAEADRQYVVKELPNLGDPEPSEESFARWNRLIDIACRTNDDTIVELIMDRKFHHLDGAYGSLFKTHLFDIFSKNPKLFFRNGIKKFGSVENIAKFLISPYVDTDDIREALDSTPLKNKDDKNSALFLELAIKLEQERYGSSEGKHP